MRYRQSVTGPQAGVASSLSMTCRRLGRSGIGIRDWRNREIGRLPFSDRWKQMRPVAGPSRSLFDHRPSMLTIPHPTLLGET